MFLTQGNAFDDLRYCRKALPHQHAVVLSNSNRDLSKSYA